ncbi:hypothetical protein BJY04DRAFT_203836 [Aspergillus karnatakaensis]|uniref:uncharacterized protein n=1 Tax=Aspergillus karnatakaensis TaxID=1810916 RepID=UPI003CCE36DC
MWPLLILAVGQATATLAQNCTLDDSYRARIRSPDDLTDLPQDCPRLDGRLSIDNEYSGPFHLPNVVNITGQLNSEEDDYGDQIGITSFDMPDLEEVGYLELASMPNLTEWSTPNLKTTEGLDIKVPTRISLDFPALESADHVEITTNASAISFPALKNVPGSLTIDGFGRGHKTAQYALNISLPALQHTGMVTISGDASGLSLPELISITGEHNYGNSYSRFHLLGTLQAMALPKLGFVNGNLAFSGNISSLSLPRLRKVTALFRITAHNPLAIDLPLEEADSISLDGLIESIHFPNLRRWRRFSVKSDIYLDCDDLHRRLNETVDDSPGEFECTTAGPLSRDPPEDVAGRFAVGAGAMVAAAVTAMSFILL